jgi:hypothetical protein
MSAIKKEWTIIRHNARGAGPGIEWFPSREAADLAGTKLAARNPGSRFVILEIVGTTIVPLPPTAVGDVT